MVAQEEIEENLRTCAQDIEAWPSGVCWRCPASLGPAQCSPMFQTLPYTTIPEEVQSPALAQASNLHSLCGFDLGPPNSLLGVHRAGSSLFIAQ